MRSDASFAPVGSCSLYYRALEAGFWNLALVGKTQILCQVLFDARLPF
jgi:hypothetical protein